MTNNIMFQALNTVIKLQQKKLGKIATKNLGKLLKIRKAFQDSYTFNNPG